MFSSPWIYFTDSILRAPTIGCMLMCLSAALVGVIAFLRKQSLIGESLSHASFPGVIIGVFISGGLSLGNESWMWLPIITVAGAFFSALLGLWLIHFLVRKTKIHSDAALCFILSTFFGIGLTLASRVQFVYPALYKQSLGYLYGQAATMTDVHILIYGILSLMIIAMVILFYKELQVLTFDSDFARSIGVRVNIIDTIVFILITLAIVVGIRSVGVVLMSAMLIAPPVAARQYTHRLWVMLALAGVFGVISGFFGNYFSVELTNYLATLYPTTRLAFPTGPMIVMVATIICIFSLLFAPERGLFVRLTRVAYFRYQCLCENILKAMWRSGPENEHTIAQLKRFQTASSLYLRFILMRLAHNGWVERTREDFYRLTADGIHRAAHIVRLHRLWEVYLADYLGVGAERVHRSAEEMEHIITPEIEQELTRLLKDPKTDPHHQPIPPAGG